MNNRTDLGEALYTDVLRFESFGQHRLGSHGADQALDWIAAELAGAGLAVKAQPFTVKRQYDFAGGSLRVGGHDIATVPQWWPPEAQATFALEAPISQSGDASGNFVHITVPYDHGGYVTAAQREALKAAFARNPAAVLLTIEHPSREIFIYNVSQDDEPSPVPVLLVGAKHTTLIAEAAASGGPIAATIAGAYRRNVPARNIVGRLDRGAQQTIVVSTPVTSWFTSTCERGPGIAVLLALARRAGSAWQNANFVFAATSGHEVGHGGMTHFIKDEAPAPGVTAAWIHIGASLACYDWRREGDRWITDKRVDPKRRYLLRSEAMADIADRHFANIEGTVFTGAAAAIGELRDVHAAGYRKFAGLTGSHNFFHTPSDDATTTGPEALAPVYAAFDGLVAEIDECCKGS